MSDEPGIDLAVKLMRRACDDGQDYGALHITLEDGNVDDRCLDYCRANNRREMNAVPLRVYVNNLFTLTALQNLALDDRETAYERLWSVPHA